MELIARNLNSCIVETEDGDDTNQSWISVRTGLKSRTRSVLGLDTVNQSLPSFLNLGGTASQSNLSTCRVGTLWFDVAARNTCENKKHCCSDGVVMLN